MKPFTSGSATSLLFQESARVLLTLWRVSRGLIWTKSWPSAFRLTPESGDLRVTRAPQSRALREVGQDLHRSSASDLRAATDPTEKGSHIRDG